jgi:hypothetical protein
MNKINNLAYHAYLTDTPTIIDLKLLDGGKEYA